MMGLSTYPILIRIKAYEPKESFLHLASAIWCLKINEKGEKKKVKYVGFKCLCLKKTEEDKNTDF